MTIGKRMLQDRDHTWMDEARESDTRDVAGRSVDAVEVPYGLGGRWKVVRQKAACVTHNSLSEFQSLLTFNDFTA